MNFPETVKVLDTEYKIVYCDSYLDVDPNHREEDEGCLDPLTSSIRVYSGQRCWDDIRQTIIHEILHAIGHKLYIDVLSHDDEKNDEQVDKIATALNKLLQDNIWL